MCVCVRGFLRRQSDGSDDGGGGHCLLNLPVAESEEEPQEDLLKPGHLSRLLEEELGAEVASLSLGEVSGALEQLLERLRTHRDTCPPQQLQVEIYCTGPFRRVEIPCYSVTQRAAFVSDAMSSSFPSRSSWNDRVTLASSVFV